MEKTKETSNRREAIEWWNSLSSLRKTQICDTNTELVGSVRRWETLIGREIEMLYDSYKMFRINR